jgi:RNA polymerase sporulation-specific sigma factor
MLESYQDLTDEQLIAVLKDSGDTDGKIMDYILDKYKPLVRKKANAVFLIGGETDDLIQEGMIGLFKAIRDFDNTKEASFFHFAELCITRQLYKAVEASNRKKHAPLNSYVSFYSENGENGYPLAETLTMDGIGNPEQMMIDQENVEQFWKRLRIHLSRMEREVLDQYLAGLHYQQIAEKMGKTPKSIDNALSRIKAKIREMNPEMRKM